VWYGIDDLLMEAEVAVVGWMDKGRSYVERSKLRRSEGLPRFPESNSPLAKRSIFALGRFQKITDLVRGPFRSHAPRPADWLE
jgi:hypothetical protein